jgi:adenosylhomocysteine nucleosidase
MFDSCQWGNKAWQPRSLRILSITIDLDNNGLSLKNALRGKVATEKATLEIVPVEKARMKKVFIEKTLIKKTPEAGFNSPVHLVVAHAMEAKPIIQQLGLMSVNDGGAFRRYQAQGFSLVVSGMGRINAAAATAYLSAMTLNDSIYDPIWINAGIAGHKTLGLGVTTIIRKVIDHGSKNNYFPLPIPSSLPSSDLVTVDVPEEEYSQNTAFDMEGSAFFSIATKFSPIEFVQVLKVISDNPEHGIKTLSKGKIENFMNGLAVELESLITELQKIAVQHNCALSMPAAYEEIAQRFSFTVTQTNQLRRACQRFRAAELEPELDVLATLEFQSAKQLLAELNARLARFVI